MNAVGIILADNYETDIQELTRTRTLAAIPFNGRYRLIDFALSNMTNAGVDHVGIITNKRYESMINHIKGGAEWNLERKNGGLSIMPPFAYRSNQQTDFKNRLEALQANLPYFYHSHADYVIICGSNCFGNFDLDAMLKYHVEKESFITIAYTRNPRNKATGVSTTEYLVAADGRVQDVTVHTREFPKGVCLGASIYILKRTDLIALLERSIEANQTSFRNDVLQPLMATHRIMGYEMPETVFYMDNAISYLQNNLDLLQKDLRDEIYHQENRPVITRVRDSAPAWYGPESKVQNSMIAAGTKIEGEVRNSVIFRGVHIKKGAVVENSVVMKNTTIGENAHLNYAILDKNVIINDGRMLSGYITHPFVVEFGSII